MPRRGDGKDDSKPFHFQGGPSSQIASDHANFDAKSAVQRRSRGERSRMTRRPASSGRTDSVCSTCMGTCGSGVRTITARPGGRDPVRDTPYRGDDRRVLRGRSWHVDGA